MNKIILTGVLFADPYITQSKTNSSLTIAKFDIQVEWYKNSYTKINITVFNDKAGFVKENLKKGDKVYIEARLQTKIHNDKSWLDISVMYLEKLSSNNYIDNSGREMKVDLNTAEVLGPKQSTPAQQIEGLDLHSLGEEKPQQTQQQESAPANEDLSWINK